MEFSKFTMDNIIIAVMRFLSRLLKWEPLPAPPPVVVATPPVAPISNITSTAPTEAPVAPETLLWDTPRNAYHSVRVLCDEMGLTLTQKNEICATIFGESEFDNNAVYLNKDSQGNVTSRDVGVCQWNSYWHTGQGKTFPSPEYVVAHPEEAVRKMILFYQTGHINLWVAHKSGRYLLFLKPTSRMWKLA